MKLLYIMLLFCLFAGTLQAQKKLIEKRIFVTTNKTTFLVFDQDGTRADSVTFYDLGNSEYVGLRKAEKSNILRLKAAVPNFKETNLTVLTASGQYYSFLLNYTGNPDTLNYFFSSSYQKSLNSMQGAKNEREGSDYKALCLKAIEVSKKQHNSASSGYDGKINHGIWAIYISNGKLYFHISALNRSSLPYVVDYVRFSVKSKAKNKRTTLQEDELQPVYTYTSDSQMAPSGGLMNLVYVFNQFNISTDKELRVEIGEKSGDRNLVSMVAGNKIINAKEL